MCREPALAAGRHAWASLIIRRADEGSGVSGGLHPGSCTTGPCIQACACGAPQRLARLHWAGQAGPVPYGGCPAHQPGAPAQSRRRRAYSRQQFCMHCLQPAQPLNSPACAAAAAALSCTRCVTLATDAGKRALLGPPPAYATAQCMHAARVQQTGWQQITAVVCVSPARSSVQEGLRVIPDVHDASPPTHSACCTRSRPTLRSHRPRAAQHR